MEITPTNPIWNTADIDTTVGKREFAHPASVGPYQILSVLGEGGMGTVYAAEQHSPIQRRVALKLIKMGMDTREVIARFDAERQSLARMNHPNIAQVFDAGAGDSGQPYFVMELVEGVPLTQYCDRKQLSTKARLELFAQVCDAIQHAHTKGIIHRDIKPGNVLVTEINGKPTPKVIDFGIAKAIDQQSAERTVFSESGRLVGTPEYMSPEQAGGAVEDVDARTDIYSLGAMLYELLSGMPPFHASTLRSLAFSEIQRVIREVEPARPSTRIGKLPPAAAEQLAGNRQKTAAALAHTLGSELEWVPLKAMRKNRDHRYRTASELADDVRNYLAGMPLLAGPESRFYLARKFLRRHRNGVAAVAVLAVVIIAATAVASWQAARATRAEKAALVEKDAADKQRGIAQQRFEDVKNLSNRMLVDLLPDVDKLAGSTPALRKLVDMSLQYLSGLQAEGSGDVTLMQDVARGYTKLGDVQGNPYEKNLGDFASALKSYQKALELEQKVLTLTPGSPGGTDGMGTIELKIGDALLAQGQRQQSVNHYELAKQWYAKSAAMQPDALTSWLNPIVTQHRLALAHLNMGETRGPLKLLADNLDAAKKMVARFPASADAKDSMLQSMHALSTAQTQAGAFDDARATLQDEAAQRDVLLKTNPDDVHHQHDLAAALLALANLELSHYSDFDSAEQPLGRAVDLYQHGYDSDPTDVSALLALARCLNSQKDLFLNTHREDEARKAAHREIDLLQKGLHFSPGESRLEQILIVAWGSLADVYQKQNDLPNALQMRKYAVAELLPIVAADPANRTLQAGLGFMRRQTADTMVLLKDNVSALVEARAAVVIFEKLLAQYPDNQSYNQHLIRARQTLLAALNGAAIDPQIPADQQQSYRSEAKTLDAKTTNPKP
jgi:serine/threonine protein kinase